MSPLVVTQPGVRKWAQDLLPVHEYLEDALDCIETIAEPPIDLTAIGEALAQSYRLLYAGLLGTVDPCDGLVECNKALAETAELLRGAGDDPHLVGAREALEHALSYLPRVQEVVAGLHAGPLENLSEMRATKDSLSLHKPRRPVLVPTIRIAPPPLTEIHDAKPPPRPITNFDELREAIQALRSELSAKSAPAEPPPPAAEQPLPPAGFAADPLPPLTPAEFRRHRARETFEEISMLGQNRIPLLGDPWRGSVALEQRLFENIDAFVSIGQEAFLELEALGPKAQIKDPSRLFATTLVAGCIDGRDTMALAERYHRRQMGSDPEYSAAFKSALRLIPHPFVEPICRRMLATGSAAMRALAVDVMGHRGWLTDEELSVAAFDQPVVAAAALPRFAMRSHVQLRQALDRGIELADQFPEDRSLFRGVATALVLANHPDGARFLRSRLDGELQFPAAQILAIAAGSADARLLVERLQTTPTPKFAAAVGWAGSMESIPVLMGCLSGGDEEVAIVAADSLERITGAGMFEQAMVPPDKLDELDIPEPDTGEPASPPRPEHPLDRPAEGSPDIMERPTTDLRRWQDYWSRYGEYYKPGCRYRRGYPYTPLLSLRDLDTGLCVPGERRWLVIELAVRTGSMIPLDPEDFVTTQEAAIQAFRPIAEQHSRSPGTWERFWRSV